LEKNFQGSIAKFTTIGGTLAPHSLEGSEINARC